MRVIFLGTPECGCPYLPAIKAAGGEILAVITQPDRPSGRGRTLCAPPVKAAAQEQGICVFQPVSCRDAALMTELRALTPDILLVVAFGQILCPEFLDLPRVAALNVHYSLLPQLRGAAPVQHALLQGLSETGVTLQHIVPELDAGDVVGQRRVSITEDDDAATLTTRLTAMGCELVTELLPAVMTGEAPRSTQDVSQVTWAPRLGKTDGILDWSQNALTLQRRIQAMNPWPGAYCHVRGNRLEVVRAKAHPNTGSGVAPGTLIEVPKQSGPLVATGSGALELLLVRPRGRKVMSGAEYARGARLSVGEVLQAG